MLTFSILALLAASLHSGKSSTKTATHSCHPPKLKFGNRPGEGTRSTSDEEDFAVLHAKHVSAIFGFFVVQLLQYHSPSWSNPDAKGVSSMGRPKEKSSMGRPKVGRLSAPFLRFKLTPELMTLVGGKALLLENGLLVG